MAQKQNVNYPKRGEVYLVNFDPTIGAEIKKIRPAFNTCRLRGKGEGKKVEENL